MEKCHVEGCNNAVYGQGMRGSPIEITMYCRKHYRWFLDRGSVEPTKHSTGTLEERFWRSVHKTDGCWIWTGANRGKGYGVIQDTPPSPGVYGKSLLAHRVSYKIHCGEIPEGMMILHSCDNPSCVNPAHLRIGTGSENIKEAFDKGRKIVPYAVGKDNPKSKLTEEQVRFIKSNPQLGHKEIADMFGLSPNCIRGVRIGRTWTHIT